MLNSTTKTYSLKREILSFSHKVSYKLPKTKRKFIADINYGMLAAGSCLLTDVTDQLHEDIKKINCVDRLSKHLSEGTHRHAIQSYLSMIRKWVPENPVVHIDDSDVVKPDGYKFEALGLVRDGSESTKSKNVIKKGYYVTEATVLTTNQQPVSLFSKIHSSKEKEFSSINTVTFSAIDRAVHMFGKATFIMDRGIR